MKPFMDDTFLLSTPIAQELYERFSRPLPIIDYHCHVQPSEIASDRWFETITQAWLGGDHYKWRVMRSNGVDEYYITGGADDREKFQKFAEALPKAFGNPVYHWTHLELRRYFGYDGVLNGDTAGEVWEHCNRRLTSLSVRSIIRQSNVEAIFTTDDPLDDLRYHREIRQDTSFNTMVLPGWRPDKLINIGKPGFSEYLRQLSERTAAPIRGLDDLFSAINTRIDDFADAGCRIADHGLDFIPYAPDQETVAAEALRTALDGAPVSAGAAEAYQFTMLRHLAGEYHKRGWTMQLHYGAVRNTNTAMFHLLGPDTGFDCIGSAGDPRKIAGFLDELAQNRQLPKTILYSLNPVDNAMLGSILGCFQDGGTAGKLQHGSAWWFNDTKTGMQEQLTSLANLSLLGNFVGMLTDSRSFLSYTRHEYFRRILCDLLGRWVENGEIPSDVSSMGMLISDVSYYNAKRYFGV